jgi:hypothetical protein
MNHLPNVPDHELTHQLGVRCQRDQRSRLSNSEACTQLFRLALVSQNQSAWTIICNEFRTMVYAWVYTYSSFHNTDEDASYFVNEAFARLWQFGSPLAQKGQFNHLSEYLQYLKRCVWSAIEDYQRKQQKDALRQRSYPDRQVWERLAQPQTDEQTAEIDELAKFVWQLTQHDPLEKIVAEETWFYDLPPRTIQERHPEQFKTVTEVNQIKRNILRRLQRHPKVQAMLNS